MKTLTARSIGQERVVPLDSDRLSLGMECSEESDAFLPDRNAPRGGRLGRKLNRSLTEDHPTYQQQHQRDPVEDVQDQLWRVLSSVKPRPRPLPGYQSAPRGTPEDRQAIGIDCDEVYPGIFVGDMGAARNKQYLQRIGVTHVLNCAEGKLPGQVNTGHNFYKGCPIKYMGLDLLDLPKSNIKRHFQTAAEFIETALKENGRVLVHCVMGLSRSSTCVIAFLMLKKDLSAAVSLKTVRENREVRPNAGFMRQLAEYDLELCRKKSQRRPLNMPLRTTAEINTV